MILVISTEHDEHARAVLAMLEQREAPATLLDLSQFPKSASIALRYSGADTSWALGCEEHGLDLDDCGAVWWRRPQPPQVSDEIADPGMRRFALSESAEALQGLWHALDAFWINDPARDHVAQRKVHQLRVAQQIGLAVPETLITNCSRSAREFIARRGCERVVYKSFSATEELWRETRVLRREELDLLENVRFAPVIFQEYVEADVDLRITVVGDRIFAAAIHSQATSYKVDCRMDIGSARIEACELPSEVEARLRAYMGRLGLVYGAIDMRRTPDGRYVFLEINPAGQWLFIEQATRQPIAEAMVDLLVAHDGGGSSRPADGRRVLEAVSS